MLKGIRALHHGNGLEAIIFDVDGTIAETERDGHRRAFNAAFVAAGFEWHWDPVLYGELLEVAGGQDRIRHFWERFGIKPPGLDPAGLAAELHRAKTAHYLELLQSGTIPLRPGVRRLWQEARAEGVRLAIATTAMPEGVRALLEHSAGAGVSDWFEVIAAGDVVPNKKPAPDIYLYVLERIGLGPEACVAIEDSDNGVQAAQAAGIRTLVVTVNHYTVHQDFSGVPLVVDGLGEPGIPPQVFRGDLHGRDCVDLAVLRALHRQMWAQGSLN